MIAFACLTKLLQLDNYERLKNTHYKWIKEELKCNNNLRNSKWTESIGVGNKSFLKKIKEKLGFRAKGRSIIKTEASDFYQLRECHTSYGKHRNDALSTNFYGIFEKSGYKDCNMLKPLILSLKWVV